MNALALAPPSTIEPFKLSRTVGASGTAPSIFGTTTMDNSIHLSALGYNRVTISAAIGRRIMTIMTTPSTVALSMALSDTPKPLTVTSPPSSPIGLPPIPAFQFIWHRVRQHTLPSAARSHPTPHPPPSGFPPLLNNMLITFPSGDVTCSSKLPLTSHPYSGSSCSPTWPNLTPRPPCKSNSYPTDPRFETACPFAGA
jgi:hypothetical protein